MIDPIQVPILLKAIDFLFDEGRKILEERRERRKMDDAAARSEIQELPRDIVPSLPIEQIKEIKHNLLASKIEDLSWLNHEEEVQHLVRLLEIHSRNYHLAKEQYSKWGSALVPPIIMHNMTEAENSIIETIGRLQGVLSKVYKKDIHTAQ